MRGRRQRVLVKRALLLLLSRQLTSHSCTAIVQEAKGASVLFLNIVGPRHIDAMNGRMNSWNYNGVQSDLNTDAPSHDPLQPTRLRLLIERESSSGPYEKASAISPLQLRQVADLVDPTCRPYSLG